MYHAYNNSDLNVRHKADLELLNMVYYDILLFRNVEVTYLILIFARLSAFALLAGGAADTAKATKLPTKVLKQTFRNSNEMARRWKQSLLGRGFILSLIKKELDCTIPQITN